MVQKISVSPKFIQIAGVLRYNYSYNTSICSRENRFCSDTTIGVDIVFSHFSFIRAALDWS